MKIDQSTLNNIIKPTFVISESKVRRNIQSMKSKALRSNAIFRPHFKTHQTQSVGEIYRSEGIKQITVSSIDMAKQFADLGWNDITIAFPVNIRQINDLKELAKQTKLNLLVESSEVVKILTNELANPIGIYIKIDCGYGRTGLNPDYSFDEIINIANLVGDSIHNLDGLLTHAGHSYTKSNDKKRQALDRSKLIMTSLKQKLEKSRNQ